MHERRDNGYVPIHEITDWSIGGPADRPYDNPAQQKADILVLLGSPLDEPPRSTPQPTVPGEAVTSETEG